MSKGQEVLYYTANGWETAVYIEPRDGPGMIRHAILFKERIVLTADILIKGAS